MNTDFAEINGARFHYQLAGGGHPLVFVHAGIADGRMWNEQFHIFAQSHRVLRYDRRGFGQTPMISGPYSDHHDLYALLRFLDIERAHLVGCSQGAKTIVDFALEHPEMASALVLVAPALSGFAYTGTAPRQAAQLDFAEEAGDLELVNELELQVWVDGPHRSPDQVDRALRERVREMNRIALATPDNLGIEEPLEPPAAGRLGEVHAPALIITGDLDTPRTLAAADYLTTQIRGARQVHIDGVAHLPNMEKPAEFNHHVLGFLA